jgi:hypothetical protein
MVTAPVLSACAVGSGRRERFYNWKRQNENFTTEINLSWFMVTIGDQAGILPVDKNTS